ncbi:MAG: hypothetical protein C3F17_12540 [Bradyrhizobiaceae bacterium]|nr:MAG: hypothetical protein C3F17_12540 [Bradyrhizobiaceae bacterium]
MQEPPPRGHNQGPPLDETGPPWGEDDPYAYVCWKAAHRKAWRGVSRDVMLFRLDKAERLGLSYEEYTLEILERGRHLQATDVQRIAAIRKARRLR